MKSIQMDAETASAAVRALSATEADLVSFDGESLVGPDAIIDSVAALDIAALKKSDLLAYAAARRFAVENGGTTINGLSVSTDRQSQAMLNAAFNMAKENPNFSTMWKGVDGNFTQLTAEQIVAIAQAVGAFVANCFAAEAAVVNGINAGNITTRAQVDSAIVVS
ncbi:DUF4376 domain-containing protein [Bradyrhizobium zhanjiangense]|uniref:DUF4376 domain-containing protein n=1 Tax=Bradyrhizobium zhanjiangense TaxID=1325107 RepID=A0ABY0DIN3_9BRAD|nr:DUF4376 domain-containing protein [Bradyrhizobium zhanjiangense]RXG93032.1 DUF4376 domain-containing protein [Bradyrhizobium zhanjiangense]